MATDRRRVFSGVQPSGRPHIGNYIGALTQWKKMQHEYDCIFCVVDLHALTIPENIDPAELRSKSRGMAALYVASGIDPDISTIFVQSEVTAHAELAWILTCTTPLGWLQRMTQFKAKSARQEAIGSGLLAYPVLQAADILLYDTHKVPVGADQKQHIELSRDIAQRFNNLFGETFVLPEPMIPASGAKVMGLDNPEAKMSKSVGEQISGHAIYLLDSPKQIKKAIMRAKTDTGCEFRYDHAEAGIRNLITLFEVLSGESREAIASRYEGRGYGYLKKDLVDVVEATLSPIRTRYAELTGESGYLDQILEAGTARARAIADQTLTRAKLATGLTR